VKIKFNKELARYAFKGKKERKKQWDLSLSILFFIFFPFPSFFRSTYEQFMWVVHKIEWEGKIPTTIYPACMCRWFDNRNVIYNYIYIYTHYMFKFFLKKIRNDFLKINGHRHISSIEWVFFFLLLLLL